MTGVVAVGDSIINADRSWAYWLSRATGQELTRVSVGGATSTAVLDQLPALTGRRYGLACVTVGTNDVLFDWQPETFADNLAVIVAATQAAATRTVFASLSLGLGYFPGSGHAIRRRVVAANAIIEETCPLVVRGGDLRGRRTMSPDMIHPSVTGQLVLADRAAELLGITPLPSTLHDGSDDFRSLDYLRAGASQIPKRVVKRALGRAF